MPKFNDRVFGSNVDESIIDIFENLQKGSFELQALEQSQPEYQDYLGDRTTFARMWTAILVQDDKQQKIIYHIVNDNRDESYVENITDPLGDNVTNELTSNNLLKPKAGITSLSSKTEGALGAVKRTTVEFVVHNKNDFENIFLPFFLKPGASVVIDFGWSARDVELYDVTKVIEEDDIQLKGLKEFLFGGKGGELQTGPNGEEIIKNTANQYYYKEKATGNAVIVPEPKQSGFVNDYKGKVECMVGRVVDYTTNVNQQGSFECSLTVVSDNTSLLDAEITEENKLKFIFSNKMEQILISTLSVFQKEMANPNSEAWANADPEIFGIGTTQLELYDRFSEQDKNKALDDFFKKLRLVNFASNFKITKNSPALRNGIFYQNVITIDGTDPNKKDSLYIAYGLFEDLFLNGLIAKNSNHEKIHEVNYNSEDTFVRFDKNLVSRQNATLADNEPLPLFMYPEEWEKTYNTQTLLDKTNADFKSQKENNPQNQYNTPIIPLRDLFINVPFLAKTFAKKQNVNDALVEIYEGLNDDSYGVFKLKMIALNDSFSSIGVVDANLVNVPQPETKERVLKFDITSDKSIVYNLDYKFGMPKGGLASMIAIGEKGDFAFFDDQNIDNLNFTKILGPNKEIFGENSHFKTLPIITEESSEAKRLKESSYDYSVKTIKTFKSVRKKLNVKNVRGNWSDIVNGIAQRNKNKQGGSPPPQSTGETQNDAEDNPIRSEASATTDRDKYGKDARINVVLGNAENSISPILPIELSLTIYGNSYLNIGDFFSINFLPKYYTDRVIFQIVGVEQKLTTNWETTYSTVMRLNPLFKAEAARSQAPKNESTDGSPQSDEDLNDADKLQERGSSLEIPKLHNILEEIPNFNTEFLKHAVIGGEPIETKVSSQICHVRKIEVFYDKTVKKKNKRHADAKKTVGDARLLINEFNPPKTFKDVAWLYAIQSVLSDYIRVGLPKNIYPFNYFDLNDEVSLDKQVKKVVNDTIYSIFCTTYSEEKGIFGKFDDALADYLEETLVKSTKDNKADDGIADSYNLELTKLFVAKLNKGKFIKDFKDKIISNIKFLSPNGNKIDDKYGVLTPNFNFVWTHDDVEKSVNKRDARFIYIIDYKRGGTQRRLMIPDWFFTAKFDIDRFVLKLDIAFNTMSKEIQDYGKDY